MKTNIYIGIACVIAMLSLAVFGLFNLYITEKANSKRLSDNVTAILSDRAKQQELTVKEFKTLYPKYDSLAKSLNIKTKNITNVIETKYHFKDTTISKTIISHDSLNEKHLFSINDKCYHLAGYVDKDTIAITEKQVNDNMTTFLYKDWQHKYFFKLIKTKPFYTAKVYSNCLKDTISVINNIKISSK